MVTRLVLVLGDQLTETVVALREADMATDVVVMAEVADEAGYVPHHPKKIAFLFSAMRHFAETLRGEGWTVDYYQLDADNAPTSIGGALLDAAERHGSDEVVATEPGEWRLIRHLESLPLKVRLLEDDRFVATHGEF